VRLAIPVGRAVGGTSGRRPARRPARSGDAGVSVVEPVDLWDGHGTPERWWLHLAWPRTGVGERLMRPHSVVVGDIGPQEPEKMGLTQNDEMVQALTA
jgi:hypothetical protein